MLPQGGRNSQIFRSFHLKVRIGSKNYKQARIEPPALRSCQFSQRLTVLLKGGKFRYFPGLIGSRTKWMENHSIFFTEHRRFAECVCLLVWEFVDSYILIFLRKNISFIMDFLREIVSGPKNRYRKDGYNLDLTYITPRLIAMAYPAEGLESIYRNSIGQVAQFLTKNHHGNYQIINVSGRQINDEILNNIHSFYWEDHKTPQFHILFRICEIMLRHLSLSKEKITVVHCNHGKGRTGTLICCFLLYIGFFQSANQAMEFYAKNRFETEGYGVTQPCQIKYIQYFGELLKKPKMFPSVVAITKIEMSGGHKLKEPYFKLRGVRENNSLFNTSFQDSEALHVENNDVYTIKFRQPTYFLGDVILDIKQNNIVKKKMAASYSFNTAFLQGKTKVQIKKYELSPKSAIKSGNFSENFQVVIHFKKICSCSDSLTLKDRCAKCRPYMTNYDVRCWEEIEEILARKEHISAKWVLYGQQ